MIILDTSVWIEFLKANTKYYTQIAQLLEKKEVLAVECVFGELFQGIKSEREKSLISEYWKYLPKIDSSGLFIEAGIYSNKNKLLAKGVGLIDSLILVHTLKLKISIWTLDKKLLKIIPKELIYK